jgi:isochorismate hydrolase
MSTKKQYTFAKIFLTTIILASTFANAHAELPNPGMSFDPKRTAVVVTDPQNDFLSEKGVTWGVVGKSVVKNNTVENIENLLKAAKKSDVPVFVSPHYYYPTDHGWHFEGALE